jgi:4-hydroxy-tetrahydrodipicolinate synthase
MGADGGTIASSGVVPEVIMKLYHETLSGNWQEAKRIQFKLLELINAMLFGTNFPEGFRAGMSLRGFNLGTSRQLLSPKEQGDLGEIRSKIACILAECGFSEAASACRRSDAGQSAPVRSAEAKFPADGPRLEVDSLVREIMERLRAAGPQART